MLILEKPYVSKLLLQWASDTQHPVLSTEFTEQLSTIMPLNLLDKEQAAKRINANERVYTNSENALEWILANTTNEHLNEQIKLFKDKHAMREALRPLSPNLFFKSCTKAELLGIDPSALPLPVILKPTVGFCSMGVYTINNPEDWALAIEHINTNETIWKDRYPESVVNTQGFIVEQYIEGPEYAIDMYFDSNGNVQILNLMHHVFANAEDTSDRIYNTSAQIIDQVYDKLKSWLQDVQGITNSSDFPAHVEVRVSPDGTVIPIEFNPLRFAGLGGTDLAFYAWGVRTYAAYLNGEHLDLLALANKQAGKVYTMSLLNPHPTADLSKDFNYEALESKFTNVLDFHRFDVNSVGSYGFLFLQTDDKTAKELDWLLHSDLLEFEQ